MLILLAVCACAAAPSPALAGPRSYMCKITSARDASGDKGGQNFANSAVGSALTIDRRTGRVINKWIGNEWAPTVEVLDPGNSQWSFKAVALGEQDPRGHRWAMFYEVEEFTDGPVKPFLAVEGGTAYFGTCE